MATFPKIEAFVWSSKLETGIEEQDNQHRKLVEIINMIGGMCAMGAETAQIKPVLDELVS